MAVRTIVPLLTGGAIITAALAFAYTRRPVRGPLPARGDEARFAPEQVGPDDGMVEVLSLLSGPKPTARTEAEAMTRANAAWPLLDNEPPSTSAHEMRAAEAEVQLNASSSDIDAERPTLTDTTYSSVSDGFAAVDPGEAFLDLDIEFEELETPTDRDASALATDFPRERLEPYDSIAPEDLGTEWLARATEAPNENAAGPPALEADRLRLERMDTLEDIGEAQTIPAAISAARHRLARNDENAPNSEDPESSGRS